MGGGVVGIILSGKSRREEVEGSREGRSEKERGGERKQGRKE